MKKNIVLLNTPIPFETIKDKFIKSIKNLDNEKIVIKTKDGQEYKMYHNQDCCESVYIEDIIGADLKDLIGHRVIAAEEIDGANTPPKNDTGYEPDSYTWTFYRLITTGGMIVIRWYGSSNGYYSESVDFIRTK